MLELPYATPLIETTRITLSIDSRPIVLDPLHASVDYAQLTYRITAEIRDRVTLTQVAIRRVHLSFLRLCDKIEHDSQTGSRMAIWVVVIDGFAAIGSVQLNCGIIEGGKLNIKLARIGALVSAIAITGAIIGGSVDTAVAAPRASSSSVTQEQTSDAPTAPIPVKEFTPAASPLHALNGYVYFSKDGFILKAPKTVLSQVPRANLRSLESYLTHVNSDIKSGKLTMTASGVAIPVTSASRAAGVHADQVTAFASARHGYIKAHWYGIEVGLDSWLTNKVEGGTWTASGASGLAALLGGGQYAGAVAAALAVAAGEIQVCQHRDGWTIIYWLGTISPTAFACNPFG
jgi:hypothetical protein